MKYLLFAVMIGSPALAVADLSSWSSHRAYRAQLESLCRCQWLTASAEEEQQQQQKKKGEAGKDDEPDCE